MHFENFHITIMLIERRETRLEGNQLEKLLRSKYFYFFRSGHQWSTSCGRCWRPARGSWSRLPWRSINAGTLQSQSFYNIHMHYFAYSYSFHIFWIEAGSSEPNFSASFCVFGDTMLVLNIFHMTFNYVQDHKNLRFFSFFAYFSKFPNPFINILFPFPHSSVTHSVLDL